MSSRLRPPVVGSIVMLALVAGACVSLAGLSIAARPAAASDQPAVTPTCPTMPVPTPAPAPTSTRLLGPSSMGAISVVAGGQVSVAQPSLDRVTTLDPATGAQTSIAVPGSDTGYNEFVRDQEGSVYVRRGLSQVVKYDVNGRQSWVFDNRAPLGSGLFVLGSGTATRIGASVRASTSALMLRPDGAADGVKSLPGDIFGSSTNGYVTATDGGRYVRVYDNNANPLAYFGASAIDNDPNPTGGPEHFYQLGGAARTPDGQYLVTDTQAGIRLFSAGGVSLGAVPPTEIDPLGLTQRSYISVVGDYVYLLAGDRWSQNQYLVRLPLAQVVARALSLRAQDPSLGMGAGFDTGVPDNYFQSGRPVVIRAQFDPWWQSLATGSSLCWSVRSRAQVVDGRVGTVGWLPGSSWQYGATGNAIPIPTDLPAGAYELDGTLVQGAAAVSTTQMIFTVGAAGQRLSFADLPAGKDWGGPGPLRGVVLASQLGTNTVREQLDWRRLLSAGASAPLDFSAYDATYDAAGAEAKRRGVTFIVQLGQGGPERALVDNGTWQQRVQEVVQHFKDDVDVWEAWNEPNNTYGSGADYVAKVLAPVYRAVKAVDPQKTVVGGSVCGVSVGYWQQIVNAGGLKYMDVAGDHPYPGYNRSLEEQGSIPELRSLKALLVRDGKPLPLWFTEISWWSSGAASLWDQADDSARMLLWMAALGVDKWAYFLPEGGWGTWSAIRLDDYVKPSALALMNTSGQLAGRPFLGEVALNAPSAYAMRFGPRADDPASGQLLVAWTDGLPLAAALTSTKSSGTVTVSDMFGAKSTVGSARPAKVTLGSGPVFFQSTSDDQLSIASTEAFGTNLATQSAGATATASSANTANPATRAIDGDSGAAGYGGLTGSPYWVSAPGDAHPSLTVSLGQAQTIDRIMISSHSLGSVVPGLRNYTVEVRSAEGAWSTLKEVRNQFYNRQQLITFTARTVSAVRVTVADVNFGGTYEDGHRPETWPTDAVSLARPNDPWYGPAVIASIGVYAPQSVVSFPADTPASTTPSSGSPATPPASTSTTTPPTPSPTTPSAGPTNPSTTPPTSSTPTSSTPTSGNPTPPASSTPPASKPTPLPVPGLTVTAPAMVAVGSTAYLSVGVSGQDVLSRNLSLALTSGTTTLGTATVRQATTRFAVPVRATTSYTVLLKDSTGSVLVRRTLTIVATRKPIARLTMRTYGTAVGATTGTRR